MKDNSLDRIIREKLEKLTPEFRPESWELFEQRLDAEEAGVPEPTDLAIDETAFRRLHQLEKPYRPSHWEHMAARLDREFVRPEQILRYKVVELTILLLLLLPLWQWLPNGLATDPAGRPAAARSDVRLEAPLPAPQASPVLPAPANAITTGADDSDRQEAMTLPPASSAEGRAAVPPVINNLIAPSAAVPRPSGGLILPPVTLDPILTRPVERALTESLFQPIARVSDQPLSGVDPLAMLSTGPLTSPTAGVAFQALPVNRSRHLYFNMFGSLDYNRIFTPADYFLGAKVHEYDRYEAGYSGGFSLGYEMGRWEVQTGAIYSFKSYLPIQLQVLDGRFRDGYSEEVLKNVELNVLQIPVNLRYNVVYSPNWRLYALTGLSLQVATQANYYIDSQGSRRSSSLLEKFIDNGWFEGGTFSENSYLTGNVGLGVERVVNKRWSVFAQPTYQQAINFFNHGLGPTRDRISTMSIYMGIRVRVER